MKKIIGIVNSILIVCFIILPGCESRDWTFIHETDEGTKYFYDKKEVRSHVKTAELRFQIVPGRGSKELKEVHEFLKKKGAKYEDYLYSEYIMFIDCAREMRKFIMIDHIDKYDKGIKYPMSADPGGWEWIEQGTVYEKLQKDLCISKDAGVKD